MEVFAINPEDARAIAALVRAQVGTPEPILLIRGCSDDPDRADVFLGRVDGPLAGGGTTVEVRREQHGWVVAGEGCWRA